MGFWDDIGGSGGMQRVWADLAGWAEQLVSDEPDAPVPAEVVLTPPTSPAAAEVFAASASTLMGLPAAATPAGPDGGIDFVGRSVQGQVKHTSRPVGRPAVQRFVGAAAAEHRLFFALSGYTAAAIAYADERGVALFSYDAAGQVNAENVVAASLFEAGGGASARRRQKAAEAQQIATELAEGRRLIGQMSRDVGRLTRVSARRRRQINGVVAAIEAFEKVERRIARRHRKKPGTFGWNHAQEVYTAVGRLRRHAKKTGRY